MDKNEYKPKCIYCSAWNHSSAIKREGDEKNKKHKITKRKCIVSHISISTKSEACKYFKPASCFYCNANNHYMTFLSCLNRRYNPEKFASYEKCANCRQFDLDIKPIIKNFWINKDRIVHPAVYTRKGNRTIKRREKKRVIKRREKQTKHRTIKRKEKKKTIKRRK